MRFLDDPRVDVYLSVWDQSNFKLPIVGLDKTEHINYDKFVEDLGFEPKSVLIEKNNLSVVKYNTEMIHRWKSGFDSIRKSGIDYDYVIVLRPDLSFNFNTDPLEYISRYKESYGFAWTNSLDKSKLNDILFVSSYKNISLLFDSLDLDQWVTAQEHDWHTWWHNYVVGLGKEVLDTPEFNQCIFCRYWVEDSDSFKDVVDKQHDWRDLVLLQQINLDSNIKHAHWPEEITDNAFRKWRAGSFKKYLPPKSVLFLYGRLNHLAHVVRNIEPVTNTSTDAIVYGDETFYESIPGLVQTAGRNSPESIKNVLHRIDKNPTVHLENLSNYDNTRTLFSRLCWLVEHLEKNFYSKDTPILIMRADLYCIFRYNSIVSDLLKDGVGDKFYVTGHLNRESADDQVWVTSLKTLREYLEYARSRNYVEQERFLTHIALANYLCDTGKFARLDCDKVIIRNNCKQFNSIGTVEKYAAEWWETVHRSPYVRLYGVIKSIIFDLDGVLVDTESLHASCFIRAAKEILGESCRPAIEQIPHDGRTTKEKLKLLAEIANLDQNVIASIDQRKQQMVKESLHVIQPSAQKIEMFEELATRYTLALASNSRKENVDIILDRMGIRKYFSSVFTGDDVAQGKPHPEIFNRAIASLNRKPDECLIIEDSVAGYIAATSSGARLLKVNSVEEVTLERVKNAIKQF